ncbi:MAG: lantibiotic dehydratase [Neisseriaceae bacterium]
MIYRSSSYCMLRVPVLPKNYTTGGVEVHSLGERERRLLEEGILIASRDFFHDLQKETRDEAKLEKRRLALEKYYNRSTCRPTPFGIFSGVKECLFKDNTEMKLAAPERFEKYISLSPHWLLSFVKEIESKLCSQYPKASVYVNNRLHFIAQRAYLAPQEMGEGSVSVAISPLLNFVLRVAQRPISVEELSQQIKKEFGLEDTKRVTTYLQELLDKDFLISTLRFAPLEHTEQLSILINKLKHMAFDPEKLKLLLEVKAKLEIYQGRALGQGVEDYLEICNLVDSLFKTKEQALKIDMKLCSERELTLSKHVAGAVEEAAEVLGRLASFNDAHVNILDSFRRKFLEKYGVNQLVRLQDVLNETIGIGYPETYLAQETNNKTAEKDVHAPYSVQVKYMQAVKHGGEVKLEDQELIGLNSALEIERLPDSMEIYAEVIAASKKALDENDFQLQLNYMNSTYSIGQASGRFLQLLGSEFVGRTQKDLLEASSNQEGVMFIELSECPKKSGIANVMTTRAMSDYWLALGIGGNIEVEDIYLGTTSDQLYFFSKKWGKRLLFRASNVANPRYLSPLYRFLLEVSLEGKKLPKPFNLFDLDRAAFWPRVVYKRVILRPATWVLDKRFANLAEVKGSIDKFSQLFFKAAEELNIPTEVFLVVGDNRLLLAPSKNELQLGILYKEWLKREVLILTENVYGEFDGVKHAGTFVEGEAGFYFSEIVVPVKKRELNLEKTKQIFVPNHVWKWEEHLETLKEWLYLEIEVPTKKQSSFLLTELKTLIEQTRPHWVKWFFVRYVTNGAAVIRIRFNALQKALHQIYEQYLNWYQSAFLLGKTTGYKILPYEREKARYGGGAVIEEIESFFHSESELSIALLSATTKAYKEELEQTVVLSYFLYQVFSTFIVDSKASFFAIRPSVEVRRKIHKHRRQLTSFLKGGMAATGIDSRLIDELFHRHLESAKKLESKLEESKEQLTNSKGEIIASLIHMQCNRLFGTDRDRELLMLSLLSEVEELRKHL